VRSSGAKQRSKLLRDWSKVSRYKTGDNLRFFADALRALANDGVGNGGRMVIGLLGQRDIPGVALRNAQAVLRWDLRPSLWSHVFLISRPVTGGSRAVSDAALLEVPMYSRMGTFPQPERNAVSDGRLGSYRSPEVDANAAVIAIQMTDKEARDVERRARDFNVDRLRYDLWEALGVWQAYLWSAGQAANPLREGFPIPSSAYVEMAFEALNLDLTPATSERNSAPEHIWNAAVWWHEAFQKTHDRAIRGFYVVRDPGGSLMDAKP
jgi:hypothetical protein